MVDWTTVEGSEEFQELVRSRRRFAFTGGAVGIGFGLLYVVLAQTAPGLMGESVVLGLSLGFFGGVLLILLTWVITLMYMRRSERVWGPLEQKIRDASKAAS